jgi:hypothetical protein
LSRIASCQPRLQVDPATPPALQPGRLKFLISTLNQPPQHPAKLRSPGVNFERKFLVRHDVCKWSLPKNVPERYKKTLLCRRKEEQDFPPHTPGPWPRGVLRRDICHPQSLRETGSALSSVPRRGTLHYQGRPAGECCVNKFSLTANEPCIV